MLAPPPTLDDKQITAEVGVSPATISRILRRLGLNRLQALEPAEPIRRYEREHAGELLKSSVESMASAIASPATAEDKAAGVPETPGRIVALRMLRIQVDAEPHRAVLGSG